MKTKYSINYLDNRNFYDSGNGGPAPESACAGETVRLCVPILATDTRYEFFVDGELFSNTRPYGDGGIMIEFVMPEHDVDIDHKSRNTMTLEEYEAAMRQKIVRLDFGGKDYWFASEETKNGKTEFVQVRKEYYPGEPVVIYYPMIATDTDYSFTIDGVAFSPDYETRKGFVFRFMMPDHDVEIRVFERNSMLREPAP